MHVRRGLTREESTNASQPHNGHGSQNRSTDTATSGRSSGTRRIQRHHCLLAVSLGPYSAQNIHVFVLSFAMRFPGRIHHFRRIQAVNLERYIAAQDIEKSTGHTFQDTKMGYSNKFRAPKYLKLEANSTSGYPVRVNHKNSVAEGFGPRTPEMISYCYYPQCRRADDDPCVKSWCLRRDSWIAKYCQRINTTRVDGMLRTRNMFGGCWMCLADIGTSTIKLNSEDG